MATAQLEDFIRQIGAIEREAKDVCSGLTDERLLERPAPGQWSVVECLEHLNATARQSFPLIDKALADARTKGLYSQGPFRHRFLTAIFIRSLEPPARVRVKTSQPFTPPPELEPGAVKTDFMALKDELRGRIEAARGLDLARVKVPSPFMKFVHYTLFEFFAVLLAHDRRHLWQARRVREKLEAGADKNA